jgi:hypothetical protein
VTDIVRDETLRLMGMVRADSKRRVSLLYAQAGEHFHVYETSRGQYVLDPMLLLGAAEDPEILKIERDDYYD